MKLMHWLIAFMAMVWCVGAVPASAATLGQIATCKNVALVQNHLTEQTARHIREGTALTINSERRALARPSSVWVECGKSLSEVAMLQRKLDASAREISQLQGANGTLARENGGLQTQFTNERIANAKLVRRNHELTYVFWLFLSMIVLFATWAFILSLLNSQCKRQIAELRRELNKKQSEGPKAATDEFDISSPEAERPAEAGRAKDGDEHP